MRRFLPELIELIWNRQINPGKVFDFFAQDPVHRYRGATETKGDRA
jgi:hypothetical protein